MTRRSSPVGTTKTTSIAILIGSGSGTSSTGSASSVGSTTAPLVVWTLQERTAAAYATATNASKEDAAPDGAEADMNTNMSTNDGGCVVPSGPNCKFDLVYYEFLDDTARWTHLDQLLLQLVDTGGDGGDDDPRDFPSVHVGSSENLDKKKLTPKRNADAQNLSSQASSAAAAGASHMQKLVRSLQSFLDDRLGGDGGGHGGAHVHVHSHVPVDQQTIEASLSHLLVQHEQAQLAVRGNLQLSEPLIRQGLALWLQSRGLYGTASLSSSSGPLENSVQILPGTLESYLVMDRTAAQAIHLLPPPNDAVATVVGGNLHTNSLWGLLSKPCLTPMGRKQLQVWLRQPLVDLQEIHERQEAVTRLLGMAKDSIREGLRNFGGGSGHLARLGPSLSRYRAVPDGGEEDTGTGGDGGATRVTDTKKPLETLYQLYLLASHHLPHLLDCMECIQPGPGDEAAGGGDDDGSSKILDGLYRQVAQLVGELERSAGLAEAVLDLDSAPREFMTKAGYSEELREVHKELQAVLRAVDDEHAAVEEAWSAISPRSGGKKASGSSQVRLERVEDNSAWQFRLPDTNDSKSVESLGKKIKTHRILKNGVYFSSLELRQLSAKYQDLQAECNRLSRTVVQEAMEIAATYASAVDRAAEAISNLDVFCALAHTAAMSPHGYCRPTITDSDEDGAGITLEGARHPCLELQEDMEYIPNDLSLSFPNAQLLVSGPNMGGKSVYIRSVGAIVAMAQIGSYVPCTSATVNICHAILARVGAGDLQERGISTFMAEMLESSSILRSATKRSLIIIDELGRGTSTFDGYGLARAIMEYLMERVGCLVVFATHFHELTRLPGIQNCHVTAQTGSQGLTFLYQVRPGPCLESFGIQVAEMAHVPKVVIEDAKKRARELENFDQSGGPSKRSKSDQSDSQMKLERFARLDLKSILKDVPNWRPEERRAKFLELLSA